MIGPQTREEHQIQEAREKIQIDAAWECLERRINTDKDFDNDCLEPYRFYLGGGLAWEASVESVFEYMLENDWDRAITDPAESFRDMIENYYEQFQGE